jgi:hypothetical protein
MDDKPVYVNPDLVTLVRDHGEGTTTISFNELHSVTVKMGIGGVASTLFNVESFEL